MSTLVQLPFAGGELSSFDAESNRFREEVAPPNAALRFDGTRARCCLSVGGNTGGSTPRWAEAANFWFHANDFLCGGNLTAGVYHLNFYDEDDIEVFRIALSNGPSAGISTCYFNFYTLQAGVMTYLRTYLCPAQTYQTIDINLVAGADGVLGFYNAGVEQFRVTGLSHSGFGGVSRVRLGGGYIVDAGIGNSGASWSEVICDDRSHIGDRLRTLPIDTNSAANTGFTGTVTDINEVVTTDVGFINSVANGDISTFYANGYSFAANYTTAFIVAARAKAGESGGPQNLQLASRVSGANYVSETIALGIGYQAATHGWRTNPAGGNWSPGTVVAAEGGVKAIT